MQASGADAIMKGNFHTDVLMHALLQTVQPSANTATMLFWAPISFCQINLRKVDGWQMPTTQLLEKEIDLAA